MRSADAGLGLLYLVGPLAAALLATPGPFSPGLAGGIFAMALAYARLSAFLASRRGLDEAVLGMELLPFLAWITMRSAGMEPSSLPLHLLASALSAACLYAVEDLLAPKTAGFLSILAFCAAAAGTGAVLALLPALPVAAASLLLLVILAFAKGRFSR